ncbi:uncharacterized protein MKK02DRAFT_39547 [Dioszegia hungarica]|uniref:Uncharacterized protein n=1 Tax=Dioszegia hungarica TaxID=4972 RepID=A0AA38HGP7_9TREE|nr:uncharacterized protein MKK02DRAFT_39547 [Dioszegia hungarica]KAI9639251.1 hypothetical protein MKK02DRAFT_39547 [Dioszegia hungarica]
MLLTPLLAILSITSALCRAAAVPVPPIRDDVPTPFSLHSDPDLAVLTPLPSVLPVKLRQTTKEDILRRATKRVTAPRAFSSTSPNGFTGKAFVLQRTGSGSYLGQTATTATLTQGYTLQTATRFIVDSQNRVVTETGGLILYTLSASTGPSEIRTGDTATATANALTCKNNSSNSLSCTRFAAATPGQFCLAQGSTSPDAGETVKTVAGFGNTCTSFKVLSLTVVDI